MLKSQGIVYIIAPLTIIYTNPVRVNWNNCGAPFQIKNETDSFARKPVIRKLLIPTN